MRSSFKRSDVRSFLFEAISSQMFEEEDQSEQLEDPPVSLAEDEANMILGYIKQYTTTDDVDVRKRKEREDDLKIVTGEVARVRDAGGGEVKLEKEDLEKLKVVVDFLDSTSQDKDFLRRSGEEIKVTGIA